MQTLRYNGLQYIPEIWHLTPFQIGFCHLDSRVKQPPFIC